MNITVHDGILLVLKKHDDDLHHYWDMYSPVKTSFNYIHDLEVVNVFLRNQLGQLNLNQSNYHLVLRSKPSLTEWLSEFEKYIIPILKEHGIPYFNDLGYEPKRR